MNRSILLLSLAAFFAAANTRVCDPLLPQLAGDFEVPYSVAASAITAFTFAYGTFQLVYGGIGTRLGPFRTASWAVLLSATGSFGCALATDLTQLTVARFWSGMTIAAVIPMAMAHIGETVTYETRQAVIARFLSGQVLGVVFGQAFGGLFAEWLSWRQLFALLGMGSLIIGAALFHELRSGRVPAYQRPHSVPPLPMQYLRVLEIPWARVVLVTVLIEGFFCFGAFPYIGAHLDLEMGLSNLAIGLVMSGLGVGGLIYVLAVGILVRRLGEKGLVLWGGLVLSSGFLLVAMSTGWPAVALATFTIGLGYYMFHNTLQTNATQMAPFDRSAALALFAFGLFFGQAAGAATLGPLAETIGFPVLFIVAATALICLSWVFRRLLVRRSETSSPDP